MLPAPRANPILLGHAAAEATLGDALAGGRLHHAWLITGPEGIGKATLAYRFARRLLAGLPTASGEGEGGLALDPSHPVFRRVASGAHADLVTVERGYDEKRQRARTVITVDDVRRVAGFMALTPAEGGWRIAVVDGAEEMNQAAANALLKVLEEPPARAVLLLVSAAPGRLLPTIRSRCRRLRLSALADADMAAVLAQALPEMEEADRGRLATLAEGSPGRALLLARDEGLAIAALVDEVLAGLPALAPQHAHVVADKLGRGDTGFSTFMDLLRAALAAALRETLRGRADPAQERLVGLRPLAAWGDVWHGLTRLQDETERFALDKRQAIVAGLALLAPST
ncbi:MAG: DNA polymerase III subunit delta' [Rhodospirillales bacterium]|jgi:DNA polymerase-3 subunit delta'|nr:DNA polymerase III subunit delta' [Rhodospirillales bacterium]